MKGMDIKAFSKRLGSMLKVDFRRMFVSPLAYIMLAVSLVMPILILVMTSFVGGTVDPTTGEEVAAGFTNVWQAIGSLGGSAMSMDMTAMCNINLVFFLIAIFVCVFVSEDFRSGYAKNIFTVRSDRADYVCSKTVVCFAVSVGMLLMFFIGAMIGGAIAGLPFSAQGVNAGGVICSMLSKIFFALVFVSIALTFAAVGKQRLWLSILCALACSMLLFTMIPMITPLNANAVNVIMCLAGGGLFAAGLGAVSNVVLKKTSIV